MKMLMVRLVTGASFKRFNQLVGLLLCPVASKALASKGLVGPLLSS